MIRLKIFSCTVIKKGKELDRVKKKVSRRKEFDYYLEKSNIVSTLSEALSAHLDVIFTDDSSRIGYKFKNNHVIVY